MRKEGGKGEKRGGEMGGFMGYRFLQCPYIAYSCEYPIDKIYIYGILFIDERDMRMLSFAHIKSKWRNSFRTSIRKQ